MSTPLENFIAILESRNTHLCIPGNPDFTHIDVLQARINRTVLSTFEERLDYDNRVRATWIFNRDNNTFNLNQLRTSVKNPPLTKQHQKRLANIRYGLKTRKASLGELAS